MSLLFWIALGGALGALARYGLSGWVQAGTAGTFPWGTLAVNVLGCFLLGFAFRVLQFSALSPTLIESELFGYRKGAFTDARQHKPGRFSLAEKGTLFLDEVGELSPAAQGCPVAGLMPPLAFSTSRTPN